MTPSKGRHRRVELEGEPAHRHRPVKSGNGLLQRVQSAWHQQNTGKMHDFGLRTLITAPVGIPISGPNRPETLENTAKKRFDLLIPERLDPKHETHCPDG